MDNFSLIGDFLRQLLVSLATKEHEEICFPIELSRKLEELKNKPNRATMRPSCALSGGNFGVVTGFIDRCLKYAKSHCDQAMSTDHLDKIMRSLL